MLRTFRADVHIHTCLSPCADIDMSPKAIVEQAEKKGLDIIAICDHNSAENVAATRRAASGRSLTVLGGMEITSEEEAHVLALFDEIGQILELQGIVYDHLPKGPAAEIDIDDQIVVNEFDLRSDNAVGPGHRGGRPPDRWTRHRFSHRPGEF